MFSFWNFFLWPWSGVLQDSTARTMPQISFYSHYQIETWIKSRNQQDCLFEIVLSDYLSFGYWPAVIYLPFSQAQLQMNTVPFSMDIFLLSVCWR